MAKSNARAWKNAAPRWSSVVPNTWNPTRKKPSAWKQDVVNAKSSSPTIPRLPPAWKNVAERCVSVLKTVRAARADRVPASKAVARAREALKAAGRDRRLMG